MPDLLLHSLTFYAPLLEQLAAVPANADIVEIGSESGEMSALLAEWAARRGGRLSVVEPFPSSRLLDLAAARSNVQVVAGRSPAALTDVPAAGLYVVDGDHNYATVQGELEQIFTTDASADTIAVLHDVGWPSGRRDQYYDPTQLAPKAVHPHSWDRGAVLDSDALAARDRGFRGEGAFAFALREGGPANGVLTAVEDVVRDRPQLSLLTTPLVFGLGVVGAAETDAWQRVVDIMRPYTDNPTLVAAERNRVQLLLHVIEMQDTLLHQPRRESLRARIARRRDAFA